MRHKGERKNTQTDKNCFCIINKQHGYNTECRQPHNQTPRPLPRTPRCLEQAGQSPAAFLRSERLRVAARLLTDPRQAGRTVEQIGYAAGFEDPTTFTRAFRRAYGCAPREWRAAGGA